MNALSPHVEGYGWADPLSEAKAISPHRLPTAGALAETDGAALTSSLLTLRGRQLVRAGVRPGDLLVATEGGAITFAIRCRQRCTVR